MPPHSGLESDIHKPLYRRSVPTRASALHPTFTSYPAFLAFPEKLVLWGLLLPRQLLFNDCEGFRDFVLYCRKVGRQQRLFRVDHNVHIQYCSRTTEPDRLAQTAFHAIALNSAAQGAAYGKSYAKSR